MNNSLNQYDGIIFDMDGTLIDSMPGHMKAWQQTAQIHGFPYDEQWQYSLGGVPTLKIAAMVIDKYRLRLSPEIIAETKRKQWNLLDDSPVLIDETYAAFRFCLGQKRIAIGTGSVRSHAEDMLTKVGLIEQIDALVTACDVKHGKPHPETFLTAAQQIGIAPERCLVFEDTAIGEQAAVAAGMDCIRVDQGRIRWPL